MSMLKAEDNKKWINALIAVASILLGIVFIRFAEVAGEFLDLEAKIAYFQAVTRIAGFAVGSLTFLFIWKNKKASNYLDEVYGELIKVVWPDKDSMVKLTLGVIVGLTIVSLIFVTVDWGARQLLSLIY